VGRFDRGLWCCGAWCRGVGEESTGVSSVKAFRAVPEKLASSRCRCFGIPNRGKTAMNLKRRLGSLISRERSLCDAFAKRSALSLLLAALYKRWVNARNASARSMPHGCSVLSKDSALFLFRPFRRSDIALTLCPTDSRLDSDDPPPNSTIPRVLDPPPLRSTSDPPTCAKLCAYCARVRAPCWWILEHAIRD
jgi:hypothetical protein